MSICFHVKMGGSLCGCGLLVEHLPSMHAQGSGFHPQCHKNEWTKKKKKNVSSVSFAGLPTIQARTWRSRLEWFHRDCDKSHQSNQTKLRRSIGESLSGFHCVLRKVPRKGQYKSFGRNRIKQILLNYPFLDSETMNLSTANHIAKYFSGSQITFLSILASRKWHSWFLVRSEGVLFGVSLQYLHCFRAQDDWNLFPWWHYIKIHITWIL